MLTRKERRFFLVGEIKRRGQLIVSKMRISDVECKRSKSLTRVWEYGGIKA